MTFNKKKWDQNRTCITQESELSISLYRPFHKM